MHVGPWKTKRCKACGHFLKQKGLGIGGRRDTCDESCARKHRTRMSLKWAKDHPDERKLIRRKYYKKNSHKILSVVYQWRKENRDKVNAVQRKCYRKNPTARLAANKRYRDRNPDKGRERNANWVRKNPEKRKIHSNRYAAKMRRLKFLQQLNQLRSAA